MKAIVFNLSKNPIDIKSIVQADEYVIFGPYGASFDLIPHVVAQQSIRKDMDTIDITNVLGITAYVIIELSVTRVACAYMLAAGFQAMNIMTNFWFVTGHKNEFIAIDQFFVEAHDWAMTRTRPQ